MANMAMTKRSTPVGESLRAGQSTSEDESKSSEHMDNCEIQQQIGYGGKLHVQGKQLFSQNYRIH